MTTFAQQAADLSRKSALGDLTIRLDFCRIAYTLARMDVPGQGPCPCVRAETFYVVAQHDENGAYYYAHVYGVGGDDYYNACEAIEFLYEHAGI